MVNLVDVSFETNSFPKLMQTLVLDSLTSGGASTIAIVRRYCEQHEIFVDRIIILNVVTDRMFYHVVYGLQTNIVSKVCRKINILSNEHLSPSEYSISFQSKSKKVIEKL